MRVLIAVPVFNEEQYVKDVLNQVRLITHDVLAIDDGSTDRTPEILDGMKDIAVIRHAENQGYGSSLIDAFGFAASGDYEWVITIDCDDQHEPARIPAFIEQASGGNSDVISGSRYLQVAPGDTIAPRDRQLINQKICALLDEVLGYRLTDSFCGFKAYRVEALQRLVLSEPGYAFPLQFWVQAAHQKLHVCELPVTLIYNDPTRHFGGLLDDPEARMKHYLEVFETELGRVGGIVRTDTPSCEALPCASTSG